MGISNLSWNERRVKIECDKCCNIKYGHHPRADTLWCTVDDFIDGRCYTKKVNLTEKSFCMCFFYCRVRQPCCSYNSLAQRKTVVTAIKYCTRYRSVAPSQPYMWYFISYHYVGKMPCRTYEQRTFKFALPSAFSDYGRQCSFTNCLNLLKRAKKGTTKCLISGICRICLAYVGICSVGSFYNFPYFYFSFK